MTTVHATLEEGPSIAKKLRRKAKKLRKLARRGAVTSQEQCQQCARLGINLKAQVDWSPTQLQQLSHSLCPAQLRHGILHLLLGSSEVQKPRWLHTQNAGLLSAIVLVGLNLVDTAYLEANLSQLPFLQSCTRPMPIRYHKQIRKTRCNLFSLLFYPRKHKDGKQDIAQEDAESNATEDTGETGQDSDTESTVAKSGEAARVRETSPGDYVLAVTHLRSLGFPLPPSEALEAEGEGADICCNDDLGSVVESGLSSLGGDQTTRAFQDLQDAHQILSALDGMKVAGLSRFFYETTKHPRDIQPPYCMAALDCEMCRTAEGPELTRLTLVDDSKKILLDSFVRPYNAILDYQTRFSGVTAEIMQASDVRLEQVQVALLRLLSAETILVGHSLDQDLMVVGLIHLRCIDTSILYPHPRAPQCRFALRALTRTFLKRSIQTSKAGHCSFEDAVAALELVQLKVAQGPTFGGHWPDGEDVSERENFLDRLASHGRRCALVAGREILARYVCGSASAVVCGSNEDAVLKAKAQVKKPAAPHFMWVSLAGGLPLPAETMLHRRKRRSREAQHRIRTAQPSERPYKRLKSDLNLSSSFCSLLPVAPSSGNLVMTPTIAQQTTPLVDPDLLRADQMMAELYESLPSNTLLTMVSQPDVQVVRQLAEQRRLASQARTTLPWHDEHENVWRELAREAQSGLCFMRIK